MTPADYAKWYRRQAQELGDRADRALSKAAARGAKLARQRTVEVGAVDSGRFARSWQAENRPDGYAVVDAAPYAGYADQGRPPGSPPPVTEIVRWVERKFRLPGPAAWAVARKIAEHIAARGIRGAHILEWLAQRLEIVIPQEIEKEFSR